MNPDIKAKWVARLRDPNVKQGIGALRAHDDRFCCLGVLCELAVEAGVIPAPKLVAHKCDAVFCTVRDDGYEYAGERLFLPPAVQAWAGVDRSPAVRPVDGDAGDRLASMNDRGESFAAIADAIEAGL